MTFQCQSFFDLGTLQSMLSQKKFDLKRSCNVGQINKAQNADLKIAFFYKGLISLFVLAGWHNKNGPILIVLCHGKADHGKADPANLLWV